MKTDETAEKLIALERSRCEAVSAGDLGALGQLLAEELTHTHISGLTQTKDEFLERITERPRNTTRGDDLRVRVYGDTAVMTGTLRNSFNPPDAPSRQVEVHALQVWVDGEDGWKQVAFAASGKPAAQ